MAYLLDRLELGLRDTWDALARKMVSRVQMQYGNALAFDGSSLKTIPSLDQSMRSSPAEQIPSSTSAAPWAAGLRRMTRWRGWITHRYWSYRG